MTAYMTHIDYTDWCATVPGTDTGIGATKPLSEEQRAGLVCIDCDARGYGLRPIGRCADGPVQVCDDCYVERLRDHIIYLTPAKNWNETR